MILYFQLFSIGVSRKNGDSKNPALRRPREDPCGQRCNNVSLIWLWITVLGTAYTGLTYILPALYPDSPVILLFNQVICYVILIEMIIHWCFLRCVKSPFNPQQHQQYMAEHTQEVQHGGFEINMNDIKKSSGNQGQYTLPKSSIQNSVNKNLMNGTLYVVEADQKTDNTPDKTTPVRRLVYPYWSWKPCIICQSPRPPRAHHCPICGTCVLKRDHHCFFSGSCVGLRNQRYFVSFVFWGTLATVYCFIQALVFFFTVYTQHGPWYDILMPVAVFRWCRSSVTSFDLLLLVLLYSVTWFCLTSLGFLREQVNCVKRGITSFEQDTHIKITNTNQCTDNIRAVFGDYWMLSVLAPLHWLFPCADDGVCWPNVKA